MPTAEAKTKLFSDRIERIQISATMAVVMEAAKLREQGADLVDFGAGEPHFSTPEHIKEAAIAAIRANFSKYTPVAGTTELRQAIVERHAADFGSAYKPAECIASNATRTERRLCLCDHRIQWAQFDGYPIYRSTPWPSRS